MNWKKIVRSKTLWLNLIAVGAVVAQQKYGYVMTPETEAIALAGANAFVRFLTNESLMEG